MMETSQQIERLEAENRLLKKKLEQLRKYSVEIFTSRPLQSCGDHVQSGMPQIVSVLLGCGFTDKDWEFVKGSDHDIHYRITVERIEG